jgi:hypothetical protein
MVLREDSERRISRVRPRNLCAGKVSHRRGFDDGIWSCELPGVEEEGTHQS